MKKQRQMSRETLEMLHSVLRRVAERAEHAKRFNEAEQLARAVAELEDELAMIPKFRERA